MAALQRRQEDLAACLRWLLGLPNLRAVRFAGGGSGSMLSGDEFGLLLQLVAAHPEAAGSLQHIGVWTEEMGRQFDAGVLAPLTRLRSLQLKWYSSADLSDLPPSVRSVSLQRPGRDYMLHCLAAAREALAGMLPAAEGEEMVEMPPDAEGAAVNPAGGQAIMEQLSNGQFAAMVAEGQALLGQAAEEGAAVGPGLPAAVALLQAVQQLHDGYAALGYVNPLPQLPSHRLEGLTIDADGMHLSLSASPLFSATRNLTVARAERARLLLPMPALPGDRALSLRVLFHMASGCSAAPGPAALATAERLSFTMSIACAEALLEAFRAAPALAAARLGARNWTVGLAGYSTGVDLRPQELLLYVAAVLASYPERFGYLRAASAAGAETAEQGSAAAGSDPGPAPLLLTRSAVDSLVVSQAAATCRGASKALDAVLACWAAGLVLGPALGLLPSGSSARAWVRLGKAAALLGIPALLLGSMAQRLDTPLGSAPVRVRQCSVPAGARQCVGFVSFPGATVLPAHSSPIHFILPPQCRCMPLNYIR